MSFAQIIIASTRPRPNDRLVIVTKTYSHPGDKHLVAITWEVEFDNGRPQPNWTSHFIGAFEVEFFSDEPGDLERTVLDEAGVLALTTKDWETLQEEAALKADEMRRGRREHRN